MFLFHLKAGKALQKFTDNFLWSLHLPKNNAHVSLNTAVVTKINKPCMISWTLLDEGTKYCHSARTGADVDYCGLCLEELAAAFWWIVKNCVKYNQAWHHDAEFNLQGLESFSIFGNNLSIWLRVICERMKLQVSLCRCLTRMGADQHFYVWKWM